MTKPRKKRPWLKFYPQDWRGDAKLRSCSIGARGLWMEMVCIMHEAEPYGHLLLGGAPVSSRQLAALAGVSSKDCLAFLLELGAASVYSRTPDGVIYSRRMVRDEERSIKGRADAEKRWGGIDDDNANPNGLPDVNPNAPPISPPNGVVYGVPITPESRYQTDAAGERREREPLVSKQAVELAQRLLVLAGHSTEFWPPGWIGAAMRVNTWLKNGWPPEIILTAVEATAKRKHGPPASSVQFFEKAILEEIDRQNRPLPDLRNVQTVDAAPRSSSSRPGGGFATISAKLRAGQSSS